jgi:CRISPR/Cas system-associated exonuclease Cas4 (RecB family)
MTLPYDFQFSQASLQDYEDCRRRFQLRYLLKLSWPAVEAEPVLENERNLQLGAQFHRMIQQHLIGLDSEHLSRMTQDADLQRWWQNYLRFAENPKQKLALVGSATSSQVETTLSAFLAGFRLIAKYDAIVLAGAGENVQVTIFDWKTSSKRPPRGWLANRLQTRIYPYLVVRVGASLNQGSPIQPEQIEMHFWFANYPDNPERFHYTSSQYERDAQYLASLVQEIDNLSVDDFYLTNQDRNCRFCTYRSLCDRGIEAGMMDEAEFEQSSDGEQHPIVPTLDFDQVAEIEF